MHDNIEYTVFLKNITYLSKLYTAEQFAKQKHVGMTRNDGKIPYFEHLKGVVDRLKNIGIADDDVLSAAWLHDIIEYTDTTFDELEKRFDSKIAVLVLALSKDMSLSKAKQEEQYVKQLRGASFEAKLIKLCDISANLKDVKNAPLSKTKKVKTVRKILHYLNAIKPEIVNNKDQIPGITSLIEGINEVIVLYGQKAIKL